MFWFVFCFQLKAYRDDFNEEKRIRERYCRRNVELENQLEEAKQIVETQQKKVRTNREE